MCECTPLPFRWGSILSHWGQHNTAYESIREWEKSKRTASSTSFQLKRNKNATNTRTIGYRTHTHTRNDQHTDELVLPADKHQTGAFRTLLCLLWLAAAATATATATTASILRRGHAAENMPVGSRLLLARCEIRRARAEPGSTLRGWLTASSLFVRTATIIR